MARFVKYTTPHNFRWWEVDGNKSFDMKDIFNFRLLNSLMRILLTDYEAIVIWIVNSFSTEYIFSRDVNQKVQKVVDYEWPARIFIYKTSERYWSRRWLAPLKLCRKILIIKINKNRPNWLTHVAFNLPQRKSFISVFVIKIISKAKLVLVCSLLRTNFHFCIEFSASVYFSCALFANASIK